MPFVALELELDADEAERLSDALLGCGTLSVAVEDALAGTEHETAVFDEPGGQARGWPRVRLTALFDASSDPRELLARACAESGVAAAGQYRLAQVEDEDWVRKSQSQFAPIRISARLWIVPSWHQAPDPDAVNILLDPGNAFGTGSHVTTRLCLAWLEREVRGGETVLDYGCGSGILAIAAAKLGAARVIGVDIDAAAVAAARENAARNAVSCEFLGAGSPLALRADLVVSNILANPLKLLAGLLFDHTAPGGRIALAGILRDQAGEVEAAYARGFDFEPPLEEGGWVLLSGKRKAWATMAGSLAVKGATA